MNPTTLTRSTLLESYYHRIHFKDGQLIESALPEGVKINPIDLGLARTLVADFPREKALLTLNYEAKPKAYSIEITKLLDAKTPVLVLIESKKDEDAIFLHYNVKTNSSIKLVEAHLANERGALNMVSIAHLAPHSAMDYVSISTSDEANVLANVALARVDAFAKLTHVAANFTKSATTKHVDIALVGEQAMASTTTVAFSHHDQETLFKTNVEHFAPRSEGYIEHYGVASGKATMIFEGIGKIHKNMAKSIAKQSNRGIVIGAHARLDANPLLLIDEHDVEAGHGAAIGQIDEDQLYYLMSRGLNRRDAETLIIKGYLAPLKKAVKEERIHELFDQLLAEKTR